MPVRGLRGALPDGDKRVITTLNVVSSSILAPVAASARPWKREPPAAAHTHVTTELHGGRIDAIDNRRLARNAKLAGAPRAATAGGLLHPAVGDHGQAGEPLLTVHAESPGELAYARHYADTQEDVILIREE